MKKNQHKIVETLTKDKDSYFDFYGRDGINGKVFPNAFFSIVGLMAEDAGFNLNDCYYHLGRLFIKGSYSGEENELMLRFCEYNIAGDIFKCIVVARVQFIHRRKGYMTRLYAILKKVCRAFGYDAVLIESALTQEMIAWCAKNNMVSDEIYNTNYIDRKNYKKLKDKADAK